jgi:hypothetical protein
MKWNPFRFTRRVLRRQLGTPCFRGPPFAEHFDPERAGPRKHATVPLSLEELETRLAPSVNALTYHDDIASTGLNAYETQLDPTTVKVGSFQKLYVTLVDGEAYAEPLVDTGITITDGVNTQPAAAGVHDVVFVATEHDSLYAIDAGHFGGAVLWKRTFLDLTNPGGNSPGGDMNTTSGMHSTTTLDRVLSGDVGTSDISPEIGITGTPVIDPSTNVLYVVVKTKETIDGTLYFVQRLHAINISDGTDAATPFLIGQTTNGNSNTTDIYVYGSGDGGVTDPYNGTGRQVVQFNALRENEQGALNLVNNQVYVEWTSHGDNGPFHGWVAVWNIADVKTTGFQMTGVFCTSPNNGLSGIGQEGGRLAFEADGSAFYFETSNGSGGAPTLNASGFPTNANYNDALVKLVADPSTSLTSQNPNGWGLKVADYFIPYDVANLDNIASRSGAPMLLPDSAGIPGHPHLMVAGGEEGKIYVVDRDNMGHFNVVNDNVVNAVPDGIGHNTPPVQLGGALSTAAFFNGQIYWVSGHSPLVSGDISNTARAYSLNSNGTLTITSQTTISSFGYLPGSVIVSANGTTGGITWVMDRNLNQIHAYDATTFATELWNSGQRSGGADNLGTVVTLAVPTVANAKVYVGTTNSLVVYGIPTPPVTTTTLSSSTNASVFGQPVSFTATVQAAPGSTPSGTVDFKEGSTDLTPGGVTLTNGQATFSTAALVVGSHTITAVYSGDSNFIGSQGDDSASPQVVTQDGSSSLLVFVPGASVFGQDVAFFALVSAAAPGAGTPTGSVDFQEGSTDLTPGGVTLTSGHATFTTASLSVGSHTITVSYSGDNNFIASSSSTTEVVSQAATTMSLFSSANTSAFGQGVVFRATVRAMAPGTGTPTGTVDFKDGTTDLTPGGITLSGGEATFGMSTLTVGSHTITASYSGDVNYTSSHVNDAASPQVVKQAPSHTVLTTFPDPAVFGQVVTMTVIVRPVIGNPTPTGTVTFLDGTATLGSVSLSSAAATFTTAALSRGNHVISADYSGDGNFLASAYTGYGEPVQKDATTTSVTASANPAVVGTIITLTASVMANAPGAGKPTGTVTFKDITAVLGTATLNSAGQATLTTSTLALGTHAINVSYGGDTNFLSSYSPNVAEVVNAVAQATLVNATPTSSTVGSAPLPFMRSAPLAGLNAQSVDNFFSASGGPHRATTLWIISGIISEQSSLSGAWHPPEPAMPAMASWSFNDQISLNQTEIPVPAPAAPALVVNMHSWVLQAAVKSAGQFQAVETPSEPVMPAFGVAASFGVQDTFMATLTPWTPAGAPPASPYMIVGQFQATGGNLAEQLHPPSPIHPPEPQFPWVAAGSIKYQADVSETITAPPSSGGGKQSLMQMYESLGNFLNFEWEGAL